MKPTALILLLALITSAAMAADETGGYHVASPSRLSRRPDSKTLMLNRRLEDQLLTEFRITDAKFTAGLPGVLRRERREKARKITPPARKREAPTGKKRRKREKRNLRRFYLLKKNE